MGPSTAARQQQEEEQLLASCLGLLDIKQAEGAKLLDISPAMFRKPNAKAFELIMYHAYTVVKGKAAAKKNFRGLWPLPEKDKKLSKDFYQRVQEWLKEAGRTDHSLAAFQRNPSGPKVVSFLCDVVHWALEVQHARMFPDDVLPQPPLEDSALLVSLTEPLMTAAEANNQLQVERMLGLCQEGAQMQQQAEETATKLKDMYYELTAQLREANTQEVVEEPHPPSMRLASVLPADLTSSSTSLEAAALSRVPAELQQQQEEVEQLWQQLQQYMQDFEGMRSMVQHLVGSAAHPYAIDAVQLRAYGQAAGIEGMAAAPAAALDIAALVEAWLFDVGSVCRYVKTLAGYTANLQQQQDNQQRGWLPIRPGGIGRCSFMSPLVATSDAASHATHLYAQLSLHRACRDGLMGLKTTLEQHTDQAAARIQDLQTRLSPLYEQQIRQAELEAAAAEAIAAADAAQADAANPYGHAPQPPAAADWGHSGPGLFGGNHLQLVPPTPMLQQQVARQQLRQQHLMASQQGQTHNDALQPSVPPLPLLPLSHSAAAAGQNEVLSPVLLPEGGASPDLESPHGSGLSSASSADRPAAELLMSREFMDLDLVDNEPDQLDDGGVFSTQQHTYGAQAGRGKSPAGAGRERIDFARFSLGTGILSPILAASRQQGFSAGGAGGATGGNAVGSVLGPVGEDEGSASEGAEGGQSWRSFSIGGQPSQVSQGASSTDLGAEQQLAGDDTPTLDWSKPAPAAAPAAAADNQLHESQAADEGHAAASPAVATASAGDASAAKSPSTQQPIGAGDPMAPMTAGSTECLSSAKPRRLTYAATASVASRSSASLLATGNDTPLLDTASSLSISSSDEAGDVAESAAAVQQPVTSGSSTLAALRQRFADASLKGKQ